MPIEGDNDKVKTPEQLKVERFQAEPETFIEIKDLILAVRKTPEGMAYLLGHITVNELKILRYDLDLQIDSAIMSIIAEKKSKIIPAPGGILNWVRKKR